MMRGLRLIGLTPRGRRYGQRQATIEREQRIERIVTHLGEYEFYKEQARAAQAYEKSMREKDAEIAKHAARTAQAIDRMTHQDDVLQQQVIALIQSPAEPDVAAGAPVDDLDDEDGESL